MTEEWRAIEGFPDYAVSSLGRVQRVVDRGTTGKAGAILKAHCPPNKPYLAVGLVRDGRRHPFMVHRLVMDAFHGPMPAGFERSHLDGDPKNNAAVNLAYERHGENNARKSDHGSAAYKPNARGLVLAEGGVIELRSAHEAGDDIEPIAKRLGVSLTTARRAATGRTWKHLSQEGRSHGA